jgi:hypothetical protein
MDNAAGLQEGTQDVGPRSYPDEDNGEGAESLLDPYAGRVGAWTESKGASAAAIPGIAPNSGADRLSVLSRR